MNCPSCGNALSERGLFCKVCGNQSRCMICRELLEPEAIACVECGTRVGQGAPVRGESTAPAPIAANRNTLSFHEDRNSRRFEASLTDEAMEGLGDVFGELFVQRGAARVTSPGRHIGKHLQLLNGGSGPTQSDVDKGEANSQEIDPEKPASENTAPDKERLLKIFTPKDDTFELSDNRLKATNGADYLRRLTYLFLYAHECYGRTSAPEDALKSVLRSAKILDRAGNAVRWLNKRVGIASEGEDKVKLNAKGREDAQKALSEALDSKVADTWNPDVNQPKRRGPKKKQS